MKGENLISGKGKNTKKFRKALNRDFEYINAGRILVVADNQKITSDLINSLCFKLDIDPNRIYKADLIKFIDSIKDLKEID